MKHYITSDLHLFHRRIIKYANRTAYKMTNADTMRMTTDIVNYIDKNVPDERGVILWNLGDVFYGPLLNKQSRDDLKDLIAIMRGKHRRLELVMGNHDKQFKDLDWKTVTGNTWVDNHSLEDIFRYFGFDDVYFFPVLVDCFIFSHEPVSLSNDSKFYNVHGHTHQMFVDENYFTWKYENHDMVEKACKDFRKKLPDDFYEKPGNWQARIVNPGKYINACWDASLTHILEIDFCSAKGCIDVNYMRNENV